MARERAGTVHGAELRAGERGRGVFGGSAGVKNETLQN